jgi:hypothetical protein
MFLSKKKSLVNIIETYLYNFEREQGEVNQGLFSAGTQLPRHTNRRRFTSLVEHLHPPPHSSSQPHQMAKTKSNRKKGSNPSNWSGADHDARTAKRIASLNKRGKKRQRVMADDKGDDATEPKNEPRVQHDRPLHQLRKPSSSNRQRLRSLLPSNTYKRTHLAHDNADQIELSKLRLATKQIERQVEALRERLECWDVLEEEKRRLKLAELMLLKEKGEGGGDDGYGELEGLDKSSIEYRMKLHAINTKMDEDARRIAVSKDMLVVAKNGVNNSKGRRKGKCNVSLNCLHRIVDFFGISFIQHTLLSPLSHSQPEEETASRS